MWEGLSAGRWNIIWGGSQNEGATNHPKIVTCNGEPMICTPIVGEHKYGDGSNPIVTIFGELLNIH